MSDPKELCQKLHELCQLLEKDLEKNQLMGKNIGIKIKFVSYEIRIRSKSLPSYIWTAKDIERIAKVLLLKELPINIRLMGIRMSAMKQRGSEDESVRKVNFINIYTTFSNNHKKYFTKLPLPEYASTDNKGKLNDTLTDNEGSIEMIQENQSPMEDLPVLVCPICNGQLILDNSNFNKHVDECLSKVEVKAILKDQLDRERSSNRGMSHRPTAKRVKR